MKCLLIFFMFLSSFPLWASSVDDQKDPYHFYYCETARGKQFNCHEDTQSKLDFFNDIRYQLNMTFEKKKKKVEYYISCYEDLIKKGKQEISVDCETDIEIDIESNIEDQYHAMRQALALREPEVRREIVPQNFRPKTKFTINIEHLYPGLVDLEPLAKEEIENLKAIEREEIKKWEHQFYFNPARPNAGLAFIYKTKKRDILNIKKKGYSKSKENKKISIVKKVWDQEIELMERSYIQGSYKTFFIENLKKSSEEYKAHLTAFPLGAYLSSYKPSNIEIIQALKKLKGNIETVLEELSHSKGIDEELMIFQTEIEHMLKSSPQSCCTAQKHMSNYISDKKWGDIVKGTTTALAGGICFYVTRSGYCGALGGALYLDLQYDYTKRQHEALKKGLSSVEEGDYNIFGLIEELEMTKRIESLFVPGGIGAAIGARFATEKFITHKVAIKTYSVNVLKTKGMRILLRRFTDPIKRERRRWVLLNTPLSQELAKKMVRYESNIFPRTRAFQLKSWDPLTSTLQLTPRVLSLIITKRSHDFTPIRAIMHKLVESPLNKIGYATTQPVRFVGSVSVTVGLYALVYSLIDNKTKENMDQSMLFLINNDRRFVDIKKTILSSEEEFNRLQNLTAKEKMNITQEALEHIETITNSNVNSSEYQETIDDTIDFIKSLGKKSYIDNVKRKAILTAQARVDATKSYHLLVSQIIFNNNKLSDPQVTKLFFTNKAITSEFAPIMQHLQNYLNENFWKDHERFDYKGKTKLGPEDFHKLMVIFHKMQILIAHLDIETLDNQLESKKADYSPQWKSYWESQSTQRIVKLYRSKKLNKNELKFWLMEDIFTRSKFDEFKALNIVPVDVDNDIRTPITLKSYQERNYQKILKTLTDN
jgi:hypothetical protein